MFFEALQAYYAPTALLLILSIILMADQLLTRREKRMFLLELGVVGLMILTTWTDRCVSAITVGEWWRLRFFTSALQFAAAPLSPLILLRIYRRNHTARREWLLALPALITALFALSSCWTGLVLRVTPGNVYSRGPLFLLPFVSSALYMIFILHSASRRETPGRRREARFLLGAGVAIAGACVCEIVFVIRYMIWSTTAVMLLCYFLLINIQKVLYDPQTGLYSRLAYAKRLESIREGQALTLAMIDMNGLKAINDQHGHEMGDLAITQVTQALLSAPLSARKLYRYGGDEFVLVAEGWRGRELEEALALASQHCGAVAGTAVTFAYGVVEYRGGDLHQMTEAMDRRMYQNKAEQTQDRR